MRLRPIENTARIWRDAIRQDNVRRLATYAANTALKPESGYPHSIFSNTPAMNRLIRPDFGTHDELDTRMCSTVLSPLTRTTLVARQQPSILYDMIDATSTRMFMLQVSNTVSLQVAYDIAKKDPALTRQTAGLHKIIAGEHGDPEMAITTEFAQQHPNSFVAFMSSFMGGRAVTINKKAMAGFLMETRFPKGKELGAALDTFSHMEHEAWALIEACRAMGVLWSRSHLLKVPHNGKYVPFDRTTWADNRFHHAHYPFEGGREFTFLSPEQHRKNANALENSIEYVVDLLEREPGKNLHAIAAMKTLQHNVAGISVMERGEKRQHYGDKENEDHTDLVDSLVAHFTKRDPSIKGHMVESRKRYLAAVHTYGEAIIIDPMLKLQKAEEKLGMHQKYEQLFPGVARRFLDNEREFLESQRKQLSERIPQEYRWGTLDGMSGKDSHVARLVSTRSTISPANGKTI